MDGRLNVKPNIKTSRNKHKTTKLLEENMKENVRNLG